jgi:hypothetical protein
MVEYTDYIKNTIEYSDDRPFDYFADDFGDGHYEVETLYYNSMMNYMVDEDGHPRPDILDILPVFEFEHFKEVRGTYYVKGKNPSIMYELVFPLYGEEDFEEVEYE